VDDPKPEMYWTMRQAGRGRSRFPIMVRVSGSDPTAVAPQVRRAVQSVDPTAAVTGLMPMNEIIARSVGRPRFYLTLLTIFAGIATVLAVAGIYGVMSYAVAQRTRELGIRSALGSTAAHTLRLVARQGMTLVLMGLVLGLAGAAAVTRLLVGLLFGVSPLDPATWTLAALALASAGLLATLLPALRATRVDPAIAMRVE
jgi:ABC-type antimicrobial peptide transport system permease subunit